MSGTKKGVRFQSMCFVVEGLNSFALTLYNSYLFFYLRQHFNFHDRDNLVVAAAFGFIYLFSAWQGGRFAQKFGYCAALKLGLMIMALALVAGAQLAGSVVGQLAIGAVMMVGQCFTWPALEALISESEEPNRLPHAVGMYNVTWAVTSALAFFVGGTLVQWNFSNLFYVPLAVMAVELAFAFWLASHEAQMKAAHAISSPSPACASHPQMPAEEMTVPPTGTPASLSPSPRPSGERAGVRGSEPSNQSTIQSGPNLAPTGHPPLSILDLQPSAPSSINCQPSPNQAKAFLRLAWLANPFAYIAINTLIAVIPGIAARFELTPMFAGFVCSLWCFARLAAFIVLWLWTGWHYRFRWLLAAYLTLIITFAAALTAPNLPVLIVAQVLFGGAIGLIYYSSLFYSMDAGDTKGEHGGIHEAVIGLGNCLGPAAGATALWLAPAKPDIGAWAVSGLLTIGLAALVWIRSATSKR